MAQTPEPAAETHDLFDHLWGWSQVGGALLAAVALVIALISARDSKRSADAADESARAADQTAESTATIAKIAREELDLVRAQVNRRPILRLQVDTIDPHPFEFLSETPTEEDVAWVQRHKLITHTVALQLGFANEGDADAMETVVNLIVPPRSQVWKWKSAAGGETEMVTHRTGKEFEEFPYAIYAVDEVDVRRNISSVSFYLIEFRTAGKFPIRVSASHPDSTVSVSRTVEVP